MNKHTSEPWILNHDEILFSENPLDVIAECHWESVDDNADANARRIVACVNACAGIPTELIEQGGFAAVPVSTHREVKQQRDELLVAIVHLRDEFSKLPHSLGYEITHLPDIDALISKCNND
jgi:hypothetical protein